MGRSPCCDKAAVKRGPWTAEEDARLRSYIQQHGTGGNWIALPRKVGLRRCGKSCRLRWLNYLRPDIRHGAFSDREDRVICAIYAAVGSRWSLIAAQLPGRTDNDVKNYWNTRLKKRFFSNAGTPPALQLHGAEDHHAPLLLLHHATTTTNHLHVATCTSSGKPAIASAPCTSQTQEEEEGARVARLAASSSPRANSATTAPSSPPVNRLQQLRRATRAA